MSELERKLGAVVAEIGKLKFSGGSSNFDDYRWLGSQAKDSLVFEHEGMAVRVSDLKLVSRDFADGLSRAVSSGCRNYFYEGSVRWSLGENNIEEHVLFGYWQSREKLTDKIADRRLRDKVDSLLVALDKMLGNLFHTELLEPAKPAKRFYPEDTAAGEKVF